MKKAAIIVKYSGDNLANTVNNVIDILKKYNITPMIEKESIIRLNLNIESSQISEMRLTADFVIVLGGDGTLLYSSRLFRLVDIPILAFNMGRVGFIMELDLSMFEKVILALLNKELVIKKRMKLSAEIKNREKNIFEEEVLNEVVISKGILSRMLELNIFIDNELTAKFRSDGVILSTPTGSTGYTISAGGPIVHPDMDTIIISPICTHSLNLRPIVIPGSSKIKVTIESRDMDAFITYDGQVVKQLNSNETIVVKKSPVYANIAINSERNYYSVLRNKLGWGGDIC